MDQQVQASGFVVQPRLSFKHLRDQMLFQYFVTNASYKETESLHAGQLFIKVSDLINDLGWTRKEIRVSFKRLEEGSLISQQTLPNNKGILITVSSYEAYQDLKAYKNEGNRAENRGNQTENKGNHSTKKGNQTEERGNRGAEEKPVIPTVEPVEENGKGNHLTKEGNQLDEKGNQIGNRGNLLNITAFFNNILNSNINITKTLKEYVSEAPVKNINLTSNEEVKTFVAFALRTNAFPDGTSEKILTAYFDCIRLTRATCKISAQVLVNLIEKMSKFNRDRLHYAMWLHVSSHDDKSEKYTIGIMRNASDHEVRRGLMKLKNTKGAEIDHAKDDDAAKFATDYNLPF